MTLAPSLSRFSSLPILRLLKKLAARRGAQVWLTGGTLRDALLGLEPPDLDLTASGDALELGQALAQEAGGRFVLLKAERAACRVALGQGYLDLMGLRAPDILADLGLRDFTVNALASPLTEGDSAAGGILDPTGGLADLERGVLRLAGPTSLRDDPLRVLRAFRFIASHGFGLAPGLEEELAAAAPGLFRVARERVAQEWLKLAAGAKAGQAWAAMERAQTLTRLLPELAQGRGVEQNPFHHLDVLGHNLATAMALEEIARSPREHLGDLAGQAREYLAEADRRALLMTAALLHDLGKPATCQPLAPGWASFYRHDTAGAAQARRALRRLGLPKDHCAQAGRLVELHMRPFHLLGARQRDSLSPRGLRRLIAAAGDDLTGLFLLGLADTMAGRGHKRPPQAEENLLALWRETSALRQREMAALLEAPPLLDGRRLMSALDMPPGPEVGRLLRLLRLAQLDGRVTTPEQALDLARRLLARRGRA